MKRKLVIYTAFIGILFIASCGEDFLYKAPQGSIDRDALTNQTGVELLVTSAYATLTEDGWGATPFNWTFGGIYGGDANKGSDNNDQSILNELESYSIQASNSYLDQKWEWTYKGSKRVNVALQVMEDVEDMSETLRTKRNGELHFLRAMFYFEGVKVFGPMMPWIDETNEENNPQAYNDQDIYPNIIADLDIAIRDLPEVQDSPGRANVWAAKALKAKVLMQQGDMTAAKPILKDVVENGKTSNGLAYGLEEDLDANFDSFRDNGKESVFAIQFSNDANNNGNTGMSLCYPHGSGPGGCCGFYQPSNELANSFKVDGNGLPLLDNSYRSGDPVTYKNPSIDPDEPISLNNEGIAVDPRIDFAIGRFGIPYKDWGLPANSWVRDAGNGGFYMPKKHVYTAAEEEAGLAGSGISAGWAPGSAMNLQYLSYRDLLLLYAECLANDGELAEAMAQVNAIRERAGNEKNIIKIEDTPAANYTIEQYPVSHAAFTDKETCIKAVRMERKLELAMEGQRWFDLVRWGGQYMSTAISEYLNFEKAFIAKFATSSGLAAAKTTFPVPSKQIQTMGTDESGKPYLEQHGPWK